MIKFAITTIDVFLFALQAYFIWRLSTSSSIDGLFSLVPDTVQDFRMTDAMVLSAGLLGHTPIYDPDYKPGRGFPKRWEKANIADNVKIKKFKRTVQR